MEYTDIIDSLMVMTPSRVLLTETTMQLSPSPQDRQSWEPHQALEDISFTFELSLNSL